MAEVQLTAEGQVESKIVPIDTVVGGETDNASPFSDNESTSCKISGDILMLRLPMTQCLVCPLRFCSRGLLRKTVDGHQAVHREAPP